MATPPRPNPPLFLSDSVVVSPGLLAVTSYGQVLSRDLLGVIAAYLLHDPNECDHHLAAVFAQPAFRLFSRTARWTQLVADRSQMLYRRYWSSNNYTASLFLRYDGTIDYVHLLGYARTLTRRQLDGDQYLAPLELTWLCAHREGYDLLLTRLRDRLADQLNRQESKVSDPHEAAARLTAYLALPDLIAVAHPELDSALLALCSRVPARVADILLGAQPCVIHHSLWVNLYTTYVQTSVGARLGYTGPGEPFDHTINLWRRLWLRSVTTTDDILLFDQVCAHLALSAADVAAIANRLDDPLDLDISALCASDAPALITKLDLWGNITPTDALHINRAPRLRAALTARGYTFSLTAVQTFQLRGIPSDISPLLPKNMSRAQLAECFAPSLGLILAVVLGEDQGPSWSTRYQLYRTIRAGPARLITCLLPLEQLNDPVNRAQFSLVDEEWAEPHDNSSPSGELSRSPTQMSYADMYRLLLVYVAEHSGAPKFILPRVSFHRYPSAGLIDEQEPPNYTSRRTKTEYGVELHFAGRFYARLVVVRNAATAVVHPPEHGFRSGSILFVYLPAHTYVHLTAVTSTILCTVYDYDVPDFVWWVTALRTRYGEIVTYEEEVSDDMGSRQCDEYLSGESDSVYEDSTTNSSQASSTDEQLSRDEDTENDRAIHEGTEQLPSSNHADEPLTQEHEETDSEAAADVTQSRKRRG